MFQNFKLHNFKFHNFNLNFQNFKIQNSNFQIEKMSKLQISHLRICELHGSASILEYQKNIKLRQNSFHMKDTGKSSSRKLRRVIYYTLYRMDPQKTHYKISFFRKNNKNHKLGKKRIYPPPNSRSTAL